MALSGIQIFKMLPKKNCKECGCPTCMAFSMKVAQGALKIEQCPHVSCSQEAPVRRYACKIPPFCEEVFWILCPNCKPWHSR